MKIVSIESYLSKNPFDRLRNYIQLSLRYLTQSHLLDSDAKDDIVEALINDAVEVYDLVEQIANEDYTKRVGGDDLDD